MALAVPRLLCYGLAFAGFAAGARARKPRHVLLVIIDDLGWDDLGFRNGGQIRTPNFDTLAWDGIVLDNYYVQPSCSPTRATIMTGRKPVSTGINFWIPNKAYGLPLNETTFAQFLNARGFRSHAIGKWHLGFFRREYTPTFRGFDSFYGYYEGSEDYFQHTTSGGLDFHDEVGQRCGASCSKLVWDAQGQYSTNLYTQRAVEVISAHNVSTPLFMYLAYQGVHAPRQSPEHYIKPYYESISHPVRRTFAGMVSALDEGLGNVTRALRRRGMFKDTLIVVTTDNGGPTTECSTTGQSNWPFRGSKCSVWEGGTRGTAFMYWAGVPVAARGSHFAGLAHAADWLPTVAAALGRPPTPGETRPLDGVSLWSALLGGGRATSPRTEVYYGISENHRGPAVRDAKGYKLILGGDGDGQGAWSPQQLPNSSAARGAGDGGPSDETSPKGGDALYFLPEDLGERCPLPLGEHREAVAELRRVAKAYLARAVPQATSDPSCPKFSPMRSPRGPYLGPWCDGVAAGDGEPLAAPAPSGDVSLVA